MIFHEIYGCYYKAVSKILEKAIKGSLTVSDITRIANETAFAESHMAIAAAIKKQKWQLLDENLHTAIKQTPTIPLTTLELSWLKGISLDPRMGLFNVNTAELSEVLPLFTAEDFIVFDKYNDGDSYEDEAYIKNFRTIIEAMNKKQKLHIQYAGRNPDKHLSVYCIPEKLEYSEKDDKFRLFTRGSREVSVLNLRRIISCELSTVYTDNKVYRKKQEGKSFVIEIDDQRNALERVMLHFAHFEKHGEKLGEKRYSLRIYYDFIDETELVIRVLSFGPLVKVIEPKEFRDLIKERLIMQKSCKLV